MTASSATTPSRPIGTAVWMLCTLGLGLINLAIDTGRASLCIGYSRDLLGSVGFVFVPIAIAGLYCLLRQLRSWYRFFRASAILSLLMLLYIPLTTEHTYTVQYCVEVEP